jgi:SAM-dependent methyltransferase
MLKEKRLEGIRSPTDFLRVKQFLRGVKRYCWGVLLTPQLNFKLYLRLRYQAGNPLGYPAAPWHNAVLRTHREVQDVIWQVEKLGLPLNEDYPKNWDSLAALDSILKGTDTSARILDAGAELYSVILPWLYLYGYRHLIGINLVFKYPLKRGLIQYEYGDITRTGFKDRTFDAITCLSVIEHGVNIRSFFEEAARLLKPGGILVTSTDYYCEPVETHDLKAYGVPIHVFARDEISAMLNIAHECGLEPTGEINLDCQDKAVTWKEFDLDFTFVVFTLRKVC